MSNSEQQFQHLRNQVVQGVFVMTITDARLDSEILTVELRQELFAAVEATASLNFVLNFQNVEMMHSQALRVLVDFRRQIAERSGRVVLCGLPPTLVEILQIVGFINRSDAPQNLFETAADVPAVLARWNDASPQKNSVAD